MGVFSRPDSKYLWLYLPTAPKGQQKVKTAILVGTTSTEKRDNRRLAELVYADRMKDLAATIHKLPQDRTGMPFARYADTYDRDVLSQHKGVERERYALKVLRAHFRGTLDAIDREAVQAFIAVRRKTVGVRTVNREVDLLKAMLRDAVPKYLEASPLAGMKKQPEATPYRRLLQPDEEQRLLAVGDATDRALLILGIDTLIRLGDLLDLQRSDQHGLWVTVRDPKSGRAYDAALSKRAVKALKALPKDGPYFFAKFRQAKNPRDWRGSVRQRLEYLCALADPPVAYGRTNRGITFHWATRRTGATRMTVDRGIAIPIVQRQGNWKHADVLLEIYTEAQRGDLLQAVGQGTTRKKR